MSAPAYDIVVIGAGIHGAGVAQAAAAAGYRTLVLERHAPAFGTSSRSSKLVHGGLRYLESAQLALVRESLAERERLLRLAPGLVRRVPFYLPVYHTTRRRPWQIRAGLALYALLGGWRPHTGFRSLPRAEWEALGGLRTAGLEAVFRYFDAQTDDAALTRAVLASARSLGAELLCPARLLGARRVADGYEIAFEAHGRREGCRARALVNATGPWANETLAGIEPRPAALAVELVQGAHIVVSARVGEGVFYVEAPRDARAVFVMPWKGKTLVGTTETPFHGDPEQVTPLPGEIAYLHETLAHHFPALGGEVVEAFAGLRVLPVGAGSHFHRPRETVLRGDTPRAPRLMTIYGGKLTGYRRTAAKVLARLRAALPPPRPIADTAELGLTDT